MEHIIRYGIAGEQDYLVDFSNSYDLLAINANMLAHTPEAMAAFVSSRLVNKGFFIDPLTHAFQHNPRAIRSKSTNEIKQSVGKLIEKYGEPLKSLGGMKALRPENFSDNSIKADFCRRVIEFEFNTIANSEKVREISSYLEFAGIELSKHPQILVAPYFYILDEQALERWLPLNLDFLRISMDQNPSGEQPIWAQIALSKEVLAEDSLVEKIVSGYKQVNPAGIMLWVDQFAEDAVSERLLRQFVQLIKKLDPIPVYNLYGGYFSTLLTKFAGLAGFSHSLEFGESRAVIPVGGGIPIARFYYPALHRRLRYVDAASVLLQKSIFDAPVSRYFNEVCDCETCKEVIAGKPSNFARYGESREVRSRRGSSVITLNYPLPQTRNFTIRHYLERKKIECDHVKAAGKQELLNELSTSYTDNDYAVALGDSELDYLERWRRVLQEL